MWREIRVGKAGVRPALPRNCKARFLFRPARLPRESTEPQIPSREREASGVVTFPMYPPPISGGAPSLLAASIREFWARRHWKTGKTNRILPTIGRARDHVALDHTPHLLLSQSRLMPSRSRRSYISRRRYRSRIVIGSSRISSTCATVLRDARRAPVLARRRFAPMLGR